MGFAQDTLGLSAAFMSVFTDSGDEWVVPFFNVDGSMGRFAKVPSALSECTPYEVVGVRKFDLSKVDLETLRSAPVLFPDSVR